MYRVWMAAAIGLLATACSSENEMTEMPAENQVIALDFVHPATTRVSDTGFDANDEIGVYMVATGTDLQIGGNELNNEKFVYGNSAWTSTRKTYWNEGNHDIYAYYPYAKSITDVDNYEFTVQKDQNTGGGYSKSDFLWASVTNQAASATAVTMQFSHCLSRVKVVLQKDAEYEGEIPSDCKVYIHNMVPTALIDLQAGTVEASPYAAVNTVQCKKISDTEYAACIVPQRVASRRPIVEVTTSGVSYLLEGVISLKQGYQSTITVTLSKNPQQVAIQIGGITDKWEESQE